MCIRDRVFTMLNMIWAGMILSATAVGLLSGQGAALSSAIFDGCSKALELSLTLLGVAAFWKMCIRDSPVDFIPRQLPSLFCFVSSFPAVSISPFPNTSTPPGAEAVRPFQKVFYKKIHFMSTGKLA